MVVMKEQDQSILMVNLTMEMMIPQSLYNQKITKEVTWV